MKLSQIILENDEKELALSFKAALDSELKDGQLDEIAISAIGVLTWALASNTVMEMLGSYVGKKLRKVGFEKAANKADALKKWAYNNEQNFIRFIGGIISPFIRDVNKRKTVAKGLFLLVLVALGLKAGIGVVKSIKAASAGGATLAAVKGALKGRDIANIGSEILAAV